MARTRSRRRRIFFAGMSSVSGVAKIAHPFPTAANPHDPTEPAVLNNNRHAGCVDCHNPHAAQSGGALTVPPGIRLAQTAVVGASRQDGLTAITPATNQFENCLRCHGTSASKGTTTASELWVSSRTSRERWRSTKLDSAVCAYGNVEPSGDARPVERAGATKLARADAQH